MPLPQVSSADYADLMDFTEDERLLRNASSPEVFERLKACSENKRTSHLAALGLRRARYVLIGVNRLTQFPLHHF